MQALDYLQKNYFDKLDANSKEILENRQILDSHTELKRVLKIAKEQCSATNQSENDIEFMTHIVKHEAPVMRINASKKGVLGDTAGTKRSEDDDTYRGTTSAEHISSLLQSQKVMQ